MSTLLVLMVVFGWPLAYGIAWLVGKAGYRDAVLEWHDLLLAAIRRPPRPGIVEVPAAWVEDRNYSPGDPVRTVPAPPPDPMDALPSLPPEAEEVLNKAIGGAAVKTEFTPGGVAFDLDEAMRELAKDREGGDGQ